MNNRIEWFGPHLTGREIDRLKDVLDRAYVNDGPLARELERRIAEFLGARYCVAVSSCTVGISLALMALDIGHGDEVIVPDLTFIATANAVRMTGASVKLVDVEPRRFTIDAEKLRAAIGPRTRAVIAVDVNGRGAAYDVLEPLCRAANIALICDAAEGLGSRHRGRYLGCFGDAGCFSFSANKTITSGQGGVVVTNDERTYFRLRELKDQGRRTGGTGGDDLHPVLGFNFKYTDLQAAVALAQLDELEPRLALAKRRDDRYCKLLSGVSGVVLPSFEEVGEVRQWMDVLFEDRSSASSALAAEGIGHRAFWFPLHQQAPYAGDPNEFPVSRSISARGLWLPSRFDLTDEQIERTADVIRHSLQHPGQAAA
jgi:perosamine synthetase